MKIHLRDCARDRRGIVPQPQGALAVVVMRRRRRQPHRHDRPALVAAQCLDCGPEVAVVEMLHQGDDVAAFAAAATVPNLFFDIDAETIAAAAAYGARSDTFTATDELDAARSRFRSGLPLPRRSSCHASRKRDETTRPGRWSAIGVAIDDDKDPHLAAACLGARFAEDRGGKLVREWQPETVLCLRVRSEIVEVRLGRRETCVRRGKTTCMGVRSLV
jgi:hypothetical protein